MIFSKYVPLLAVALVALMIVPQYVQATTVSNTLIVDAPSEHTGLYDSEVNVADAASAENVDTWNPAVQGMYFGSSTEESLYRFNEWTSDYNDSGYIWNSTLTTFTLFQFSSSQIISGVSEFIIRLPFYVSTSEEYMLYFEIDAIPDNTSYSIAPATAAPHYTHLTYTGTQVMSAYYVPGTGSPSTTPYYTVDNRLYYHCYAPLLPNQLYLLQCRAYYLPNQQFKIYLSPNDVCQDDIYESHFVRWIGPTIIDPTTYYYVDTELSLDVGFSFDMREGLGGQVTAKTLHVEQYDTLAFYVYAPGINMTSSYVTINLPFYTDNGSIYIEQVKLGDYYTGFGLAVNGQHWWRGDIWGGTTISTNLGIDSDIGNYIRVTVMFGETRDVTFLFNAFTKPITPFFSAYHYNLTDRTTFQEFGGTIHYYNLGVICPVMLTSNQMFDWPNYNSGLQPDEPDIQVLDKTNFFALLTIAVGLHILTGGISTIWFAVGSQMAAFTAITFPAETIVLASTALISGTPLHEWLTGNILPYYGGGASGGTLLGTIRNLIDNAWSILAGMGQWLQSVGEYIYDALMWLVDAIMDYGAILLGLLAIFVIVLIFFFAIWFQLKLWLIGLHMAKGDLEGAGKEGRDLAEAAGQVVGGVGKVL
jgi:hypothetical protein